MSEDSQNVVLLLAAAPDTAKLYETLNPIEGVAVESNDGELSVTYQGISYTVSAQPQGWTGEALTSALEQSWHWDDASAVVAKHTASLSIQSQETGSLEAMGHVCALVMRVIDANTLAVFFPEGELLWSPEAFVECGESEELMPAELWTNVRLFNLPQADWKLMDTIGSSQTNSPDHMIWRPKAVKPEDGAAFLRDLSHYNHKAHTRFEAGDSIVGPGDSKWLVKRVGLSPTAPQRQIVVWAPKTPRLPDELAKA